MKKQKEVTPAKIATLQKLIAFAATQSLLGNHCFVDYAGHVNSVTVRLCIGEWYEDIVYEFDNYCYLGWKTDKGFETWANNAMSKIQSLTPAN